MKLSEKYIKKRWRLLGGQMMKGGRLDFQLKQSFVWPENNLHLHWYESKRNIAVTRPDASRTPGLDGRMKRRIVVDVFAETEEEFDLIMKVMKL